MCDEVIDVVDCRFSDRMSVFGVIVSSFELIRCDFGCASVLIHINLLLFTKRRMLLSHHFHPFYTVFGCSQWNPSVRLVYMGHHDCIYKTCELGLAKRPYSRLLKSTFRLHLQNFTFVIGNAQYHDHLCLWFISFTNWSPVHAPSR